MEESQTHSQGKRWTRELIDGWPGLHIGLRSGEDEGGSTSRHGDSGRRGLKNFLQPETRGVVPMDTLQDSPENEEGIVLCAYTTQLMHLLKRLGCRR